MSTSVKCKIFRVYEARVGDINYNNLNHYYGILIDNRYFFLSPLCPRKLISWKTQKFIIRRYTAIINRVEFEHGNRVRLKFYEEPLYTAVVLFSYEINYPG